MRSHEVPDPFQYVPIWHVGVTSQHSSRVHVALEHVMSPGLRWYPGEGQLPYASHFCFSILQPGVSPLLVCQLVPVQTALPPTAPTLSKPGLHSKATSPTNTPLWTLLTLPLASWATLFGMDVSAHVFTLAKQYSPHSFCPLALSGQPAPKLQ